MRTETTHIRRTLAGSNERGIALLAVLAFLVLLTLIAGGLLMSVNSDRKLVQQGLGQGQALNVAEAGVTEALERIRSGEIPNTSNTQFVSQIFLCGMDELPTFGRDTLALATWQSLGDPLLYSTTGRSDDALTVRLKTDGAGQLVRFDPGRAPALQTLTGAPVYVVRSTGRQGDARSTVVTEVARADLRVHNVSAWGAVVSGGGVRFDTDVHVCGFDHRADTPAWTGLGGRTGEGGCNVDPSQQRWETGVTSDDRCGAWATGRVDLGNAEANGGPQPAMERQSGFYAGCWDVLHLTESDFRDALGAPRRGPLPRRLHGIAYCTGTTRVQSLDGDGLLYVEGDLVLRENVSFRGLIYATGQVLVDGKCWVLGALIGGHDVHIASGEGTTAILYSREAIEQAFGDHASRFVRLSWREE